MLVINVNTVVNPSFPCCIFFVDKVFDTCIYNYERHYLELAVTFNNVTLSVLLLFNEKLLSKPTAHQHHVVLIWYS